MKTYSFENLDVWKRSRELVVCVYNIQSCFPPFEKYGLGDQLRRAVVSVSSTSKQSQSYVLKSSNTYHQIQSNINI